MIKRNRIYATGKDHPMYKHGQCTGKISRLYVVWSHMIKRCEDPSDQAFKNYGERGISVCSDWHDPKSFFDWALTHNYSDNLTIDRKNNDGNYCPDNCHFVTMAENHKNRRKRENWGIYKTKFGRFQVSVGKRIDGKDHLFYGGNFKTIELALAKRNELELTLNSK